MNIPDLLIGATLMNAMPHLIFGVWKVKMLSGFGKGEKRNILWSLANFTASICLFIFKYGLHGFIENQIYTGAIVILMVFYFSSNFWYKYYTKKNHHE